MQSTTLQRGAEERKVTLYENGDSYLITVTVLQSLFHEVGHTETLYAPNTKSQAEFLFGSACLLYTSPSPRDRQKSRMPSSA